FGLHPGHFGVWWVGPVYIRVSGLNLGYLGIWRTSPTVISDIDQGHIDILRLVFCWITREGLVHGEIPFFGDGISMVGCCSKVDFHKERSIGDNSFVIFIKVDSSTIDVTINEVIPCITANHWINLDKIILDNGILAGSVGHCQ